MTYDRERWNELIGRFYEGTITLAESRELRGYVREKIARVRQAGGPEEDLRRLVILRLCTYEKEIWAEA